MPLFRVDHAMTNYQNVVKIHVVKMPQKLRLHSISVVHFLQLLRLITQLDHYTVALVSVICGHPVGRAKKRPMLKNQT
jgi:hypothetical protein